MSFDKNNVTKTHFDAIRKYIKEDFRQVQNMSDKYKIR